MKQNKPTSCHPTSYRIPHSENTSLPAKKNPSSHRTRKPLANLKPPQPATTSHRTPAQTSNTATEPSKQNKQCHSAKETSKTFPYKDPCNAATPRYPFECTQSTERRPQAIRHMLLQASSNQNLYPPELPSARWNSYQLECLSARFWKEVAAKILRHILIRHLVPPPTPPPRSVDQLLT